MRILNDTITTKERWAKMPLVEQMANIGSEISRASHWRIKNNVEYSNNVVNRALELITFTIDSISVKLHLKKLTRVREAINDYFYGSNKFSSSDVLWQKYFDHFNYAARLMQTKI
ncbi:MAG TPA: hypothetical protein EYO41_01085 [Candidatus Marinimicrobia bacterium]|nr:hypothetical protein [Candidatus Neomarinimicrobiota bacterium]